MSVAGRSWRSDAGTGGDLPGSCGGFTRTPIGCRARRPIVMLTGRCCGRPAYGGPVAPVAPWMTPPLLIPPLSLHVTPLKLRCHRCHLPRFAQCLRAFRRPLFGAIFGPGRCHLAPCRTWSAPIFCNVTVTVRPCVPCCPGLPCGVREMRGRNYD